LVWVGQNGQEVSQSGQEVCSLATALPQAPTMPVVTSPVSHSQGSCSVTHEEADGVWQHDEVVA